MFNKGIIKVLQIVDQKNISEDLVSEKFTVKPTGRPGSFSAQKMPSTADTAAATAAEKKARQQQRAAGREKLMGRAKAALDVVRTVNQNISRVYEPKESFTFKNFRWITKKEDMTN